MFKITYVLLFCAGVVYGQNPPTPTWDKSFIVQGFLELPYAEIREPFVAFFDSAQNRSRIDYYDGMVVTIQIGPTKAGEFGKSLKVAPMTFNDTYLNVMTCFEVNGTQEATVAMQSALPDMKDFQFVESKGNTEKWLATNTENGKKNTYTMFVNRTSGDKVVPVFYEMMGYDTLFGSHYDKYYLRYDSYQEATFSDANFTVAMTCGGFPGPGDAEQRILLNPMREFINNDNLHVHQMFETFKRKHGKIYKDANEHSRRLHNFKHNVRYIHSHNRAGRSYTMKVNHLADHSDGEFKVIRGYRRSKGYNGAKPFDLHQKYNVTDIPMQVDWRLYGAVTPVKDQAVCGSCWSFGTTGVVEGAYFLHSSELVRLSQQALMDCSWGYGNNGCDGGEDFRSYQFIQKYGLPTAEAYGPYLAQDSKCHIANVTTPKVFIKDYVNVTSGDKDALRLAVAKIGPISVGIDASHKSLSFYANGIYYEPECGNKPDDLDHAVLAVGYGVLNGEMYWLVKNSWSTYWGNDGYVLMSQRDNNCGVATAATYVRF